MLIVSENGDYYDEHLNQKKNTKNIQETRGCYIFVSNEIYCDVRRVAFMSKNYYVEMSWLILVQRN